MLRTAELDYDLPQERIATHPVEPRDAARLLVVDRRDPSRVRDLTIADLPEVLVPGDVMVFNTTRVLPARFRGVRTGTGGRMEGLYLHDAASEDVPSGSPADHLHWVCLLKGRHTRVGAELDVHGPEGVASGVRLVVVARPEREPEAWTVRVEVDGAGGAVGPGQASTSGAILERVGSTPLPPYILKARRDRGESEDVEREDRGSYQTVYAQAESHGASVAAPTAGLHFTPALLERLAQRGVERVDVVLHVGAGTFRPVDAEHVEEHPIHSEWCSMSSSAVERIRAARAAGRRVIAVGTTSVRTIESYAQVAAMGECPPELLTRLLITPGFPWAWTDGLLTNFHLPRSTLMALVAALLPGSASESVGALKRLYAHAIGSGYRFYSFGDAMLVI